MKITPLPSVEEVKNQIAEAIVRTYPEDIFPDPKNPVQESCQTAYIMRHMKGAISSIVGEEIIQDRDLAYTSLIQGIEARMYLKPAGQRAKSRNSVLQDIIEEIVKPLYNKK